MRFIKNSLYLYLLPVILIVPVYGDEYVKQNSIAKTGRYIVVFAGSPLSAYAEQELSLGPTRSERSIQLSNTRNQCKEDVSAYREFATGGGTFFSPQTTRSNVEFHKTYDYLLNGVAMELQGDEIDFMQSRPYVKQIYPDRPVRVQLTESHEYIHADTFRQQTGATGQGIVIAIIDTGIDYLHPALGGGIGPDFKVIGGYDFVNNDEDPMDDNGHGTHCAGIASANGAVQGIAYNAQLLAYKVLNTEGNGIFSDIIAALEQAADPDDNPLTDDAADVVSISIGGFGDPDDPISQAVDNAVAQGITCVIAAGNERDYHSITSPGCARNAITIGAANQNAYMASFSSRGPTRSVFTAKPDVVAPGVNIYSTLPDGKYGYKSGTSMATPFVAGAAALFLEAHPEVSPSEIKSLFMTTANTLHSDVLTEGAGIVNMTKLDTSQLIVEPPTVYLGADDTSSSTWYAEATLSLRNISESNTTYSLTWNSEVSTGTEVIFPPTIAIDAQSITSFTFGITVNNLELTSLLDEPYTYEGTLTLSDTTTSDTYNTKIFFLNEHPDPFEPNNQKEQATPITITADRFIIQSTGRTKIDPLSGEASTPDEDWFSFSASANDRITLNINAEDIGSTLDCTLEILDPSATILTICESYYSHEDPLIRDFQIPADGSYYIRVTGDGVLSTGAYHLIASKKPQTEWYTDLTQARQIQSLENGHSLLLTSATSFQLLDNTNSGLQLWQYSANNIIKTDAGQASSIIAALTDDPYELRVFTTDSSTPLWEYRFADMYIPSDIAVSHDGSTVAVYSHTTSQQEIIVHVFSSLTPLPKLVFHQASDSLSNISFDISTNGEIVLFSDADTTYILDTQSELLRWSGDCAERAYVMNSDGTYLAGSSTSYLFSLFKWNGFTYEKQWDFNPGNSTKIFRSGISGDGSVLVMGQRLPVGFYGLDDDGLQLYVFTNDSAEPLYDYIITKNKTNTPRDDLFGIKLPNAIDEFELSFDGQTIAVSTWGADPEQPELLIFSPEYNAPLGAYYTHGSISDISLSSEHLCMLSEGKHNFHFFRSGIPQELASFQLDAFIQPTPPFIRNVSVEPAHISPTETVTIVAEITDSDGIDHATLFLYTDNDTLVTALPLRDDGIAPDCCAHDYQMSTEFITSPIQDNYYFIIEAEDNKHTTSTSSRFPISTKPTPVLSIDSILIDQIETTLTPGKKSFLSCTIHNTGSAASEDATLTVTIQDPYVASYYHDAIALPNLEPGESWILNTDTLFIETTDTLPHEHIVTVNVKAEFESKQVQNLSIQVSGTDTSAPSVINNVLNSYYVTTDDSLHFTTDIVDGSKIIDASLIIYSEDNDTPILICSLLDDGLHGDAYPLDSHYGATFNAPNTQALYSIDVYVQDILNNQHTYPSVATFSTIPYTAQHPVLLVNDTRNEPNLITTYASDLTSIGIAFDQWDTSSQFLPEEHILTQYRDGAVIWVIGKPLDINHLSDTEQNTLEQYLEAGGSLLISGQRLSYNLTAYGAHSNTFLEDYVHADFVFKDTNASHVTGVTDSIASGLTFTIEDQTYTGEIDPIYPARSALQYDTSQNGIIYSSGTAATTCETDGYRCFYCDFDIAGLGTDTDRHTLFGKIMDWFSKPKVNNIFVSKQVIQPEEDIIVTASIIDLEGIQAASAELINSSDISVDTFDLNDNGINGDELPNDGIYSAQLPAPANNDTFSIKITAIDTSGNIQTKVMEHAFSTTPQPFLTLTNIALLSDQTFAPGALSYFDISIQNTGTASSEAITIALNIDDEYVEFFDPTPISIPALASGETFSSTSSEFFVKLRNDIPHNHQVTISFNLMEKTSVYHNLDYYVYVLDSIPPQLLNISLTPSNPQPDSLMSIIVRLRDGSLSEYIDLDLRAYIENIAQHILLYDDGAHADLLAGDGVYGAQFYTDPLPYNFIGDLTAQDTLGNSITYEDSISFSTQSFTPANNILLINNSSIDNTDCEWLIDYFHTRRQPFDYYQSCFRGDISSDILLSYTSGLVIWYTGRTDETIFSVASITALKSFLDAGGTLFIYGEDVSYYLASQHGNSFLNNYLHIDYITRSISIKKLIGVAGSDLSDSLQLSLISDAVAGEIQVLPNAAPLFYYDQSAGSGNIREDGIASALIDTDNYTVIYFDFRWDAILSNSDRFKLIDRIMSFADGEIASSMTIESIAIEPESPIKNELLRIEASLPNLLPGAAVYAEIESPDENQLQRIIMLDTGTTGDLTAGDGVFSALTAPIADSKYYVDVLIDPHSTSSVTYNNITQYVTSNEPLVKLWSYQTDDSLPLRPGTLSNIALSLKNSGHAAASAVRCRVYLQDEYINLYRETPIEFGTITQENIVSDDSYSLYIDLKNECPDGYELVGHIIIEDAASHTYIERIVFNIEDTIGPTLCDISLSSYTPDPGDHIIISASLYDSSGIQNSYAEIMDSHNTLIDTVPLVYDNEGNNFYSDWIIPLTPESYVLNIIAVDSLGNQTSYDAIARFTSSVFHKNNSILLITSIDASANEYVRTLVNLGIGFDVWNTSERGAIDPQILQEYTTGCVIFDAADATSESSLTTTAQAVLIEYLENDGTLLISGHNIPDILTHYGTQGNTFLNEYLGVDYSTDLYSSSTVVGTDNGFLDNDTIIISDTIKSIDINSPAAPLLHIENTPSAICAAYKDSSYRCAFLNFDFNDIAFAQSRQQLLLKTLDWLKDSAIGTQLEALSVSPVVDAPGAIFRFDASLIVPTNIASFTVSIYDNSGNFVDETQLYDDGVHNDGLPNDSVFSGTWESIQGATDFIAHADIITTTGNTSHYAEIVSFSTLSRPWITYDSYSITNGVDVAAGQTTYFYLSLLNQGTATAYNVTARMIANNPYIATLSASNATYGSIAPSEIKHQTGAKFSIQPSPLTPDNTSIEIDIEITENNTNLYADFFRIIVHDHSAPSVSEAIIVPSYPELNSPVTMSVTIQEATGVQSITAQLYAMPDRFLSEFTLYDDGIHNDGAPDDSLFATQFLTPDMNNTFYITFETVDILGNSTYSAKKLWFATETFTPKNNILIVDYASADPSKPSSLIDRMNETGYAFDVWMPSVNGEVTSVLLDAYTEGIIIWDAGQSPVFSDNDCDNLQTFLDSGADLILIGSGITDTLTHGGIETNTLLENYFHVRHIAYPAQTNTLTAYELTGNNIFAVALSSETAGEIELLDNALPLLRINSIETGASSEAVASYFDNAHYTAQLCNVSLDSVAFHSQQTKLIALLLENVNADLGALLIDSGTYPPNPLPGATITLFATFDQANPPSDVSCFLFDNESTLIDTIELFDDGLHNDGTDDDFLFAGTTELPDTYMNYTASISAQTQASHTEYNNCIEFTTEAEPMIEVESISSVILEPGRTSEFDITIRNTGRRTANGLSTALFVSDEYSDFISMIPIPYGNLTSDMTKTNTSNRFRCMPALDCPTNYLLTPTVIITDNEGRVWHDSISLIVEDTRAPYPADVSILPSKAHPGENIYITSHIIEGSGVDFIIAHIIDELSNTEYIIQLYDNGVSPDILPDDSIYCATFSIPYLSSDFSLYLESADLIGNHELIDTNIRFTTIPFFTKARLLVIDDDNGAEDAASPYTAMLTDIGIEYDYWDTVLRGEISAEILNKYTSGAVLIITGTNTDSDRISDTEQNRYIEYLDSGGNLILCGNNNSYILSNYGTTTNTFLNNYMHADFQALWNGNQTIEGVTGEQITEGLTALVQNGGTGECDPVYPASAILINSNNAQSSGAVAIKCDTGKYKTLLFDFKLQNIQNSATRLELLDKSMQWLLGPSIDDAYLSEYRLLPDNDLTIYSTITLPSTATRIIASIRNSSNFLFGSVTLRDTGSGADVTAGDGIFTGSYTTSYTADDFTITLIPYDINYNYAQYDKYLSFTTRDVPSLRVHGYRFQHGDNSASISETNNFAIDLSNVGSQTALDPIVTISVADERITDYSPTSIDYPDYLPSVTTSSGGYAFYITPCLTASHGEKIIASVHTSWMYNSQSYEFNDSIEITLVDTSAPQLISTSVFPSNSEPDSLVQIQVTLADSSEIQNVEAKFYAGTDIYTSSMILYDDGVYPDMYAHDNVYSGFWTTPSEPAHYYINITTRDILSNTAEYIASDFFTTVPFESKSSILIINADVDNDTTSQTIFNHIEESGYIIDYWDMGFRKQIPSTVLESYRNGLIILSTGRNGIEHLDNSGWTDFIEYITNAGNMLICGEHIAATMQQSDDMFRFVTQTLHAYPVQPATGASYLLPFSLTKVGINFSPELNYTTDVAEIDVSLPAEPLFISAIDNDTTILSTGTCAFIVDESDFRAAVVDFDITAISSSEHRKTVLSELTHWLTDWDNDGLHDAWEIQYFADRTITSGTDDPDNDGLINSLEQYQHSNPLQFDTDNDGQSDFCEYQAGTDPTDPSSLFRILMFEITTQGVVIQLQSVPGKQYNLKYSRNIPIDSSDYTIIQTITADSDITTIHDNGSAPERPSPIYEESGFYSITVE